MLEAIGLTGDQERVYRAVLAMHRARPEVVAERTGLDTAAVAAVLSSLHDLGLLSKAAPDRPEYTPVPPDAAFGPLLLRGQEALSRPRAAASPSWSSSTGTPRAGGTPRGSSRSSPARPRSGSR